MIPSCGDRQAQPHEFSHPPVRQPDKSDIRRPPPSPSCIPQKSRPGRLLSCKRLARDGTDTHDTGGVLAPSLWVGEREREKECVCECVSVSCFVAQ